MRLYPGETMEIAVAGFAYGVPMPHGVGMVKMAIDNNGNHIIHTGGQYDSKLIVPFIPVD